MRQVFDRLAAELLLGTLEGVNATIFAYGQTGSGKTFTITGGLSATQTGASSRDPSPSCSIALPSAQPSLTRCHHRATHPLASSGCC